MILYLSKNHDRLNMRPLNVEAKHDYICLNPIYKGVTLSRPVSVLLDSGAFQDRVKGARLEFEQAFLRQRRMAETLDFTVSRFVAYDYIGNATETAAANEFLDGQRARIPGSQPVFMVQGATFGDYVGSLFAAARLCRPGDCLGLGGIARAGADDATRRKLMTALKVGLPHIRERGIKDIHLFGVGSFSVLREVAGLVDQTVFNLSSDTSSFEVNSVMGKVIDEEKEKWIKVYDKADKYINYHPADLALENSSKAVRILGKI